MYMWTVVNCNLNDIVSIDIEDKRWKIQTFERHPAKGVINYYP